ncbi:TIGR00303 family protein [Tumidithrix elongata RA019]|uniref:UPF0284 protein V2H45_08945 n=1 Tax=Tumidithrix elongata BACA0141 TaxID=2716417 RepID=A0AAW9PY91_9CYAN|nr:TIGR00303 family protein [Tumidithrix elongata RA019]
MIEAYTQLDQAQAWLQKYKGQKPVFACVLGFTDTGLIPHISAAGATPDDRKYTAIADAEFLATGQAIQFPLPPLPAGASPVLISRAVLAGQALPHYIFNAGLPIPPTVPHIDLQGEPAKCLSTGQALSIKIVNRLWEQGLVWGKQLTQAGAYVILAECVVGGTTTALAVLTALGINAKDKVNSSHPTCNHAQKWQLVQQGIQNLTDLPADPFTVVAAVGDPMQIVVAGMAIAASRKVGVLLAGGTQMLAIYALVRAISAQRQLDWDATQIVVGTTRWVAEDKTGDTVGLANLIGDVPLIATQLSFEESKYAQLRAYEQGFVKEGVGAGGAAIAAHLYQNWTQTRLLKAVEQQWSHLIGD